MLHKFFIFVQHKKLCRAGDSSDPIYTETVSEFSIVKMLKFKKLVRTLQFKLVRAYQRYQRALL